VVAALPRYVVEGLPIGGGERVGDGFARLTERIVGQQRDDRR
jgi:hypothetical protein